VRRPGSTRPGSTRRGASVSPLLAVLCGACSAHAPSVLRPESPNAERIDGLWWLMLWISAAVLGIVLALMALAIRRSRHLDEHPPAEPRWGTPFIVIAGVIVPAVVLLGVFAISLRDMNAIDRYGDANPMTVHVVGHDWWWEIRYPNGAVTANEIHIPVGRDVRVELSTEDVIHSFWIPQLAPKIDLIPGRTNTVLVRADEPGRYRGQCAEFCGLQHAHMAFFVIADPVATFDGWMADEAAPAAPPADGSAADGLQLFTDLSCAGCHTIRGTPAAGMLGPDLTHVWSRQTLAAGTLQATDRNLRRWIVDPQRIKLGAVMPPTELTPSQLDALVSYLESLG
jgi:cytochrome c oxidase subunit 2